MFEPETPSAEQSAMQPKRAIRRGPSTVSADKVDSSPVAPRKRNNLDDPAGRALHGQLMGFYRRELDRQSANRAEMEEDHEFYDGGQWSEEDKIALEESGQLPIHYNVIANTINWVVGTQKRGRSDFKVLPRTKQQPAQTAERKTALLKYLSDVNRSPFNISRAFEDAVKGGIGWLECGVQNEDDGEPVADRYENWRNILHDSAATQLDVEDGRYMFRTKFLDLDIAEALFPRRRGLLRLSAETTLVSSSIGGVGEDTDFAMESQESLGQMEGTSLDLQGFERQRVFLIECWFKKPVKTKRIKGGNYNGEIYDPNDWRHEVYVAGGGSLIERPMMVMHVAVMTRNDLMCVEQSPYRHNKFPFTPIWCYRRGRDGLPYGIIRNLKGMQQDVNKRASKALAIMCSNKVIMEEGAVDDLDLFAQEVARPNAILVKKTGKELTIDADRDLAGPHMEMMSRTIVLMQSVSGVTDENLGRETNAKSGVAIGRRQDQGMLSTAGIFDNLRFAMQVHGEKTLSLVEQYFTEEKSFRITKLRGSADYVTINDGLPENDIAVTKADFVITEEDWRASVRQAQAESLLALLQQLAPTAPQVALVLLDLVIESMDISNRDELVKRVRSFTGATDPDATEQTPEQMARAQAAAAAEQRRVQLEEAVIAEKRASAIAKGMSGEKSKADVQVAEAKAILTKVQAMLAAMEAGLGAIVTADAAPVADQLLLEAGFKPASDGTFDGAIGPGVPAGAPTLLPNAMKPMQVPISPGASAAPAQPALGGA